MNHLRANAITIREDVHDSDKSHDSSFYTYDPDGLKYNYYFAEFSNEIYLEFDS